MSRLAPLLLAIFFVGCSTPDAKNGNPNNATNNNLEDGGSPDSGGGDDVSPGGPACGDSPEDLQGPCPTVLVCEYRTDPREGCGTFLTCDGPFIESEINDCDPLPDVVCPATREAASGELCEPMDAYCDYDGLVCHCTNCVEGPVGMSCDGDPTWMCRSPNPDAECPPAKPRLGSICETDAKSCVYGCGEANGRTCTEGAWRASEGGPCPVSTIKVKRDVRYLTADELAEVSAAVQAIPLAHWQYKDPALGRGEKLGFIIEDLPAATPAVDRQRLMVDLYGYTSMLVADAQARERQMRKLEARLAALEAQNAHCAP